MAFLAFTIPMLGPSRFRSPEVDACGLHANAWLLLLLLRDDTSGTLETRKVYNVIYESSQFKVYTYPALQAVAAVVFVLLAMWMIATTRSESPGFKRKNRKAISLRSVLDFSTVFFLLFFAMSKFGGAIYANATDPFLAVLALDYRFLSSDFGVFGITILRLLAWKFWQFGEDLWQAWAGTSLEAAGIGALACFSYGCCYGKVSNQTSWHSVTFPKRVDSEGRITGAPAIKSQIMARQISPASAHSLPVYAVQLYLAVAYGAMGVSVCVLSMVFPSRHWFVSSMFYYMLVRVLTDPLRGDEQDIVLRRWMLGAMVCMFALSYVAKRRSTKSVGKAPKMLPRKRRP